jgi:predicted dithiol-disulfide oxidoreductase (DUF899 family)
MPDHKVGTREEWLAAREQLLVYHFMFGPSYGAAARQLVDRRQGFGFTAFVLDDDVIYHTYSTTARGVEFLMGYYAILDRAPRGRHEGESFQTWIRRHDEYGGE